MKIRIYTLLLGFFLISLAANAQYCNPTYSNVCNTSIAADFVNNFATTGGEVNISNLNSGCSGNPGNYIYYSNMKVSAYPGNTINFSVNNGANPFGGTNWADGFGIWVDWNQDFIFDASEYVWNSVVAATYQTVFTGSIIVPATAKPGITRMRVMDIYDDPPLQSEVCATGILYGECEDYNFEVLNTSGPKFDLPPIANFAYDEGIDTVWVNSPYNFVNTSSQDSVRYWDITPLTGVRTCNTPGFGCYLSSDRNYRRTFTQTGQYFVKLVVGNKIGKDSIVKRIIVANQTRKPQVQFYFDKQTIGIGQQVQGYDYSHYGPTGWEWTIKPEPNTNTFLPNKNDPMPRFSGMQIGTFDVCLKVWNPIGADSICKTAHVQVTSGNTMCLTDSVSSDLNGYLYSNRGPVDSYDPTAMNANCSYFINPCATSVEGYIEKFNLRKNDTIIFRDGGVTGAIIRKIGGSTISQGQRFINAPTGRLHVQWKLGNNNPINGGDSGFVMKWTSVAATYTVPNVLFTVRDTIYSTQNLVYTDKTTGSGLLQYSWDANGDGTFDDFTTANGANWTFVTSQPMVRNICLKVTNCKGTGQYCKMLTILPIVQKPEALFVANMIKGFTTDNFKLMDQSRNGVGSWNWSITPAADVTFVQGTNTSQNPVVKLSKPGFYTVSLTAGNSEGNSTLVRTDYIQVLRYEEPNSEYPIATGSDIGISRVRFADVDTGTALKSPIYDKIYEKKTGTLYRGVIYQVIVSRNTGISGMERKVWLDKDLDGLFNGVGETLISENNVSNVDAIANFMIPNDIEPGRFTRLRVGISEGNTTLTPDKATSGCFEDYGAMIGLNEEPPSIALIGSNLYRVEIHKPFIDPGVSAIDDLEGQIGYKAEVISNLDTSKAGIYTIKYTVKDLYGNVSDTAYRTVQMEVNRTGPVITLIGPDTQYVEVFDDYTEAGATAVDNTGKSLDSALQVSGFVNTNTLGTYYITYEVTDQFSYTTIKKRVVKVRDTQAPVITTTYGGPLIRHQIGTSYIDGNIILIDNYYSREELTVNRSGTINVNKEGTYYLRYNVCDPSHNCTGDYFVQIEVGDTIPPMAQLLGDNPLTIDVFEPYTDPGVIAVDNFYSPASLIVIKTHNIQIGTLGEYTINYTIRDGAGNETHLSRQAEVVDRRKPEIEVLNNPFEMVRFKDYEEPGIRIHDNYYSHEQLIDLVTISTNLGVRNDTLWGELPGWKYVRYQVRDLSGNLSEVFERQVRVVEITGLNDHALSKNVSIYPNPNNGEFTMSVSEELKGKATLTLYNTLGARVYSQELNSKTDTHAISARGLAAGVYLIEIKTTEQQLLQRVVIK